MSVSGFMPTDQFASGALTGSLRWIERSLTGQIGTAIAILAIASIGFMALTGRIEIKRGATVILGCFILFSAPAIASALTGLLLEIAPPMSAAPSVPIAPAYVAPPAAAQMPDDPYAGASVPNRKSQAQDLFQK